ncbi:MAG: hypothetical protein QM757_08820 [Paludibaculum sp.]
MRFASAGAASVLALSLFLSACASKPEPPKVSAFVDAYYDALFTWSPSSGPASASISTTNSWKTGRPRPISGASLR